MLIDVSVSKKRDMILPYSNPGEVLVIDRDHGIKTFISKDRKIDDVYVDDRGRALIVCKDGIAFDVPSCDPPAMVKYLKIFLLGKFSFCPDRAMQPIEYLKERGPM